MSKQEFLARLREGLSGLPREDVEERLAFYSEMIDDRMEEGLSEAEAVAAAGSVEEIVAQAVADVPFAKIARERIRRSTRMRPVTVLLLVLGSPIWLSLAIALAAVVFSVYVSLWSVIISLWAVFASLAASSVGVMLGGGVVAMGGDTLPGIAMMGAGLICAGLSIPAFFGSGAATKGLVLLTKKATVWVKNCLIRKEVTA